MGYLKKRCSLVFFLEGCFDNQKHGTKMPKKEINKRTILNDMSLKLNQKKNAVE